MWNKKALCGFIFLLLGLLSTFALFSVPAHAAGGINPTISFEGKLVNKTSGVNIADATYNMEFKIYSGPSSTGIGDTLLFTEDWLVGSTQGGVALTSGTYQVNLGSAGAGDSVALSSLNWNQNPLWLSTQIGNTSSCTIITNFTTNCAGDGEMTPYIELTATPYSFQSTQLGYTNGGFVGTLSFASTLTGTDAITIPDTAGTGGTVCLQSAAACGFAASSGSGNYIQNQNASPQSTSNFDISGTGKAAAFDASTAASLSIGVTAATSVAIGQSVSTSTVTVNNALTITGAAPAPSVGAGTTATTALTVTGATGGATSGTANVAGAGAAINLIGGIGGNATAVSGSSTAGAGGNITIQAGNGGTNSFAGGTNGAGGSIILQAGSNGTGGTGNTDGSVIVRPQVGADTIVAFQVQNAASEPIFVVDTTTNDIVLNPGFESGVTNWTTIGTSTVTQDLTSGVPYFGLASLKAAITAASSGTQTSGGQAAFTTNILINTQYQLTFEAKCSSIINTFTYGRDDVSGTPITNTSTANCNTSWQQYTWHFTTGGTITNPLLFFTMGTATSGNFWLDSVQLVKTTLSGAQPYQLGNIQLRGVINNPATFEAISNSTTAFQILNSNNNNGTSSLPLTELTVDTLNNNIQIGSQTASTNGIDLVLNNYNATLGTEPTEVDGAMYFNSTINQFRCGVIGAWENCGGLDISNSATAACTKSTSATSCVPNNFFTGAAPSIPANYCTAGRYIHVIANGIYTGVTAASTITFSIRLGGTIIGAASPGQATAIQANSQWRIDFNITCDSTTTVTGEGTSLVYGLGQAETLDEMTGTGTTTVTNTSAQAIAVYINVGATADFTSITLEQFIVQGM